MKRRVSTGNVLRVLSHPLFTPEADEKRFLAGLPVAMLIAILLMRKGWFEPLGPKAVLVLLAVWLLAYVTRFWGRLRDRGELKRAILAPAICVALLLAVRFY